MGASGAMAASSLILLLFFFLDIAGALFFFFLLFLLLPETDGGDGSVGSSIFFSSHELSSVNGSLGAVVLGLPGLWGVAIAVGASDSGAMGDCPK